MKRSLSYLPISGLFRPARTLLTVLLIPMLALWAPVSAYAVPPWVASDTPIYSLTDVGILNGYFGSEGAAINDLGDVVGTDQGNTMRAFLYKRGKLIDLGITLAPDGFSVANSINLEGQIVGSFSPSGNPFPTANMGFLYAGGQFQTLIGPKGEPTVLPASTSSGRSSGVCFFPTARATVAPTTCSCVNPLGKSPTWAPSGGPKLPSSAIQV